MGDENHECMSLSSILVINSKWINGIGPPNKWVNINYKPEHSQGNVDESSFISYIGNYGRGACGDAKSLDIVLESFILTMYCSEEANEQL